MMGRAATSAEFEQGCALAAAGELAAARAEFAASVAAGDGRGALVHAGFLAGGIGGPRDWRGAVELLMAWSAREPMAARQLALIEAMALTPEGDPVSIPTARSLHAAKRIEIFPGLLSPDECAFIMAMIKARLRPAPVMQSAAEHRLRPAVRDADTAMINPAEAPPVVRAISARIAAATASDIRQGEPLQISRYRPGQQYRPHLDGVGGGANKRAMTAIVYLNEDYDGGETAFTELGLKVRGRTGDMLLFRNLREDGGLDRELRHAGLPVTRGAKLIATRWILQRPAYDEQGRLIGATLWS